MKLKISVLIINILCVFLIENKAQENMRFTLECNFKGMLSGTKVYLITQEKDTIASTISQGERFIFQGYLPKNGRFHFIVFDSLASKVIPTAIFLENKHITVTGILGQKEIDVEGSAAQNDFKELVSKYNKIKGEDKPIQRAYIEARMALNSARKEGDSSEAKIQQKKLNDLLERRKITVIKVSLLARQWIPKHTASLYAPYAIIGLANRLDSIEMEHAYKQLTPEVKDSYYGVELKKYLESRKVANAVVEGGIIPNFILTSPDGKRSKIRDIAANYQYTLIDFWASWCSPCRAEVPALKKLYADFKDKGLNIVGVSSDSSEAAWKRALNEDGTSWTHGIEDKGKLVSKLFDIKAIPAYILIDSKGKMLAFDCAMSSVPRFGGNLRGEALHKKIAELLKSGKSK